MRTGNSLTQSRKALSNRSPRIEHLEDRLVPGETMTGLLLLPAGLSPMQESPGEPVAQSDDSSSAASTQASSDSDESDGVFPDISAGSTVHESRPASWFNGPGTADQASGIRLSTNELIGPAQPSLVPGAEFTHGIANGIWQLPPGFQNEPAPRLRPGVTSGMSSAGGETNLVVPVQGSPSPANMAGQSVGTAAPSSSSGDATASTTPAFPLLQARPEGHHGGGGGGGAPNGYSPAQIKHAYGFDKLPQDGTGITIAIVDAYDDPNIQSDLNTFSAAFGLPTTALTKAYAQGSRPAASGGWAQEISLDVEWAHAIAPGAKILLVEAADSSLTNLLGAVDYAAQRAQVVSMSWGAYEFSGESSFDYHFNVPGVTFIAAAGDTGGQVTYPSASPNVVSVGGTTLPLDSSGNLTGAESAWSGGGGGASAYETEPTYQTAYGITLTGGRRGTPDVAYDANPYTGFAVYDSYAYQGLQGWLVMGGTSAGAPQWAGLIARVDQARGTPLSSSSLTSSVLYSAATGSVYPADYRDIVSGSNTMYNAGKGYDLATGLGSPLANSLVPYLETH